MTVRTYKRGPKYYVDYRWRGRRYRYSVSTVQKTAKEIASRIEVQVAEGTFRGPHSEMDSGPKIQMFGELCEEWFRMKEPSISLATRRFYQSVLKSLRRQFGERFEDGRFSGTSMRLHDITPRECERIIAKKRRESSSPVRANRWLTVLRSVFKSAVEWELIVRDPTRKLRKVKEPRREIILTPNDLDRILEQSDDWMKPIILTAYFTGPRRGDLLGEGKQYGGGRPLMWDDVDLDKCVITYRDTKEKEVRHVPVNEELLVVLRGLSSRFEGREVFLDAKGKPVSPERALTRFKAAAVRAGIPDASKIRFHDLRHTCGTTLIERGVDIHAVREILGHHSVQMTERYLHADTSRLRAAVARLNGTLRAQSGARAKNTTD